MDPSDIEDTANRQHKVVYKKKELVIWPRSDYHEMVSKIRIGPCRCQRESAVVSSHDSGRPFYNVGCSSVEDFVICTVPLKEGGHTAIKMNMTVTAQKLRKDASMDNYAWLSASHGQLVDERALTAKPML